MKRSCQTPAVSRRDFVRQAALGAAAVASAPLLGCRGTRPGGGTGLTGPASQVFRLDQNWLFGGLFSAAAVGLSFDDSAFARVTLPHCVARLSWQNWDPADWQHIWIYRRHFASPRAWRRRRVFLQFDGVMVGATPTLNGRTLPQHLGGYLPFRYELTEWLKPEDNVLALAVDSRWSNVPPQGAPVGAKSVDYLEAGGIHRSARLQVVPQIFICDVFAKPAGVLDAGRHVDVTCTVDAAVGASEPIEIQAELRDGQRVISRDRQVLRLDQPGRSEVKLVLTDLGNITLWEVRAPRLYEVVATLFVDGRPLHDYRVRIGFREARFELEGFFLNGRRLQLFGLNRHEIFPYVGFAMPPRVMRRDAEILGRDFNCNFVRCSHYPQSPAFLDACDERGLLVWEEVPGWGYLGDAAWKELLVRDVGDMIIRDRNRPSIVIWGTRVNESANDVELYRRTRAVAKALDDSRPTSGTMTSGSRRNWQRDWHEDVFAYDDYQAEADGSVRIEDPTPGVPYFLAEAVGQFNYANRRDFDAKYRRAGDVALQQQQALRHAQAHSRAGRNPRLCGVVAWCGFDYASLVNPHHRVKCPGVADVFRIPKLGAAFYQAQADPGIRPVIQPNFYWHFGPETPRGPGQHAAIFSNCDRLELFVNGQRWATLAPDAANYPHLAHPPFFADLDLDGAGHPGLRIDGYCGARRVHSRSFSSDPARDRFFLGADDAELVGDGADATRLVFKVVDEFGAERLFAGGEVAFELAGPGTIVGDNPFALSDSGGVGAIWIRSRPGSSGAIVVKARHSSLGVKSVEIRVLPDDGKDRI